MNQVFVRSLFMIKNQIFLGGNVLFFINLYQKTNAVWR